MPTSFNIGIDWRRKGLICWDARPGDELNLVPTPLTYSTLNHKLIGGGNGGYYRQASAYGNWVYRQSAGTGLSDGVVLGQDASNVVDDIVAAPSSPYSVGLWLAGDASNFDGVPVIMRVKNQLGTVLFSSPVINTATTWTRLTASGSTDAATTHICIEFVKNNSAVSGEFTLAGIMVVAGSTLPDGYNAGHAADLYDNVTDSVTDAEWFLGMRRAYQDDADDSMLRMRLKNIDKTFSPEYTGSPLNGILAPYRPVTVRSNDGEINRTHWAGWIESIEPMPAQYGERMVDIQAAGAMLFFEDTETSLNVQENKRTDEVIMQLLGEVSIPPALSDAWLLGVENYGEIGVVACLADTVIPHTLEQGKTTLAYAADNWVRPRNPGETTTDSFNVYRAIKDVVAAERGRFYFDREGNVQFWNRHHLLTNTTVLATLDNNMQDITYEYAGLGEFKNEIVVTCHPRAVSISSNDLLWQLEQPLRIRAGETRTFNASYRDDSENRIGGKHIRLENVTFSQGNAEIRLIAGGNRATLEITNNDHSESPEAILATAELRGMKITSFGQMEADARDLISQAFYGRRVLRMNLPSVDQLEMAQTIADFELGHRTQPAGKIHSVKLISDANLDGLHHQQQLERTIGDLISIKEAQTAHDEAYFIMGEQHRLVQRGEMLETTWFLEPANKGHWWVLDTGQLNETTRITY